MTSDVTIDIHINTLPPNTLHRNSFVFPVRSLSPSVSSWFLTSHALHQKKTTSDFSTSTPSNRRSVLHNLGAYTTVNKDNAYYFPLFFYLKVVNEAEQGVCHGAGL